MLFSYFSFLSIVNSKKGNYLNEMVLYTLNSYFFNISFSKDQMLITDQASKDAMLNNQIIEKMKKNMNVWLSQKDQESGLLPKFLTFFKNYNQDKPLYTVKDTAADLYRFWFSLHITLIKIR